MKILVLGASQGTGALTVKTALERGHAVTAFARSPQKLALEHERLTRFAGDIHRAEDVARAMPGHDAVVITASVSSLKTFRTQPNYFSLGTKHAIDAMKQHGVKRLVLLSALGTGDSAPLLNPILRAIALGWLLKTAFEDHVRQEALARDSGLEWVSARPSRLTDGPAKRKYVATTKLERVPGAISRADVADFMVTACEKPDWNGHAVQLGG